MPIDPKASQDLIGFLKKIDAQVPPTEKTLLYVGGGAALLLAYEGPLATEDVDFIGVKEQLLKKLHQLAGKNSDIHRETGYYLDVVPPGKFPQDWGWNFKGSVYCTWREKRDGYFRTNQLGGQFAKAQAASRK